jgi:hypothetical protein
LTTAIVGLLTAIVGALAGGFLRGRTDREALLRDRRLVAAADFLAAANEVLIALTEAVERVPKPADAAGAAAWLAEIAGATAGARANAHQTMRRAVGLELLFGRGSPAAVAGIEVVKSLLRLTEILNDPQRGQRVDQFETLYGEAADGIGTFSVAAHEAIAGPSRYAALLKKFSLVSRRRELES